MRPPQRDVDAVLASVLAVAGAFASFALLQALTGNLDGTSVGRLAPRDTMGRLWVFFVLAPAFVVLVGVGLPCLLRAALALARGVMHRDGIASLVAVAVGAALIVAEAAIQRSGTTSLVLVCVLCLWRLRSHVVALRERLHGPLLTTASAALLGFAFYQQRLLDGGEPSVAVAPTLFLLVFYATLLDAVLAAAGVERGGRAQQLRAVVSMLWLFTFALWIADPDRYGIASTYGAAATVTLLAVWSAVSSVRRVDESRAFL